jgi:hypothetical protein
MGKRNTALLAIAVVAILLTVQFAAVAGAAKDEKEPEIELRIHLLYEKSPVKPDGVGKPDKKPKPTDDSGSYELLARGFKWKTLGIDIHIDDSFSEAEANAIWAGATEWDDHTTAGLFASDYTPYAEAEMDTVTPDGKNEMVFGNYPEAGVIAVTYTWGIWTGPPKSREIVEFDIMFDTDFDWATNGDASSMDVQNIACHEIGHGLGLADLYDSGDDQETMYGYASVGETLKRDLDDGDIAGIQSLYGE